MAELGPGRDGLDAAAPWACLPDAVWGAIIGFLKPHHKASLRGVCRKFRELVNSTTQKIKLDPSHSQAALGWELHARFPNLQHIEVTKHSKDDWMTDSMWAQLALKDLTHIRSLTSLSLECSSQLGVSGVAALVLACPRLKQLHLPQVCAHTLSDAMLLALAKLPGLSKLKIQCCKQCDEVSLSALSALVHLTALEVEDHGQALRQVTQLTCLTNLQSVMVWSDFSLDLPEDEEGAADWDEPQQQQQGAGGVQLPQLPHNHHNHHNHLHQLLQIHYAQHHQQQQQHLQQHHQQQQQHLQQHHHHHQQQQQQAAGAALLAAAAAVFPGPGLFAAAGPAAGAAGVGGSGAGGGGGANPLIAALAQLQLEGADVALAAEVLGDDQLQEQVAEVVDGLVLLQQQQQQQQQQPNPHMPPAHHHHHHHHPLFGTLLGPHGEALAQQLHVTQQMLTNIIAGKIALLQWVSSMPSLTHIDIQRVAVNAADLAAFAPLTRLRHLGVGDLNLDEEVEPALCSVTKLVSHKVMAEARLKTTFPSLRALSCDADDASLANIAHMTGLQHLFLWGSYSPVGELTDAGLGLLSTLTGLDTFRLEGVADVTDGGWSRFVSSHASLTRIDLVKCGLINDIGYILSIGRLPALRRVSFSDCRGVNAAVLTALVAFCPKLTHLEVADCQGVSLANVRQLLASVDRPDLDVVYRKGAASRTLHGGNGGGCSGAAAGAVAAP